MEERMRDTPTWRHPDIKGRAGLEDAISDLQDSSRHLVLNFDINMTIVMVDSVTNTSIRGIGNHVLASAAWGKAEGLSEGLLEEECSWTLTSGVPSVHRPEADLVSFSEFVELAFPGGARKEKREHRQRRFTEPGEPGEALKAFCDEFTAKLQLPSDIAGSEAAKEAGLTGHVFVIPAFFSMLLDLKSSGRSFTLCFRTFGNDLERTVKELNCFCEGRHPLFPGAVMDGSDGGVDYRISMGDNTCSFGTFYRGGEDLETMSLVLGTLQQPRESEGLKFYEDKARFPEVQIFSGSTGVCKQLDELLCRPGSMALRDYFPCWRSLGMGGVEPNGGKVLFIDPMPEMPQHIFFDDNITYESAKIVDVRLRRMPSKVLWIQYLMACHLVRAEPLYATEDTSYFTRHIANLSKAYESRITNLQRLRRLLRRDKIAIFLTSGAFMHPTPDEDGEKRYDPWEPVRVAPRTAACMANHEEEPSDHAMD